MVGPAVLRVTVRRLSPRRLATAVTLMAFAVVAYPPLADAHIPCRNNARFTLQSLANPKYVTAELNQGGDRWATLRARASVPQSWEYYTMVCHGSGYYVSFRAANGRYVGLYWGGKSYNTLKASGPSGSGVPTDLMHRFEFDRISGSGDSYVIGIRANIGGGNLRWVSTEISWLDWDDNVLNARATVRGPWEQYALTYD